jgi:hypothetical protein
LSRRVHLGDFIEKQRPAFGRAEQSRMIVSRAAEGASFVTEQFALNKVLRQCRAVQRDERLAAARSQIVDRTGNQFLAGSARAPDQQVSACCGGELDPLKEDAHHATTPDQTLKARPLVIQTAGLIWR